MQTKTDEIASKHLGKKSSGSETYDNSLLVAVPRCENRNQYQIQNENLPFYGFDIWHAYEFSCITENGIPVTRVMKLKYNCNNEFLVESKSLKLYLNSFNMSAMGKTIKEALDNAKVLIEKDLSEILQTTVEINFLDNNITPTKIFSEFKDIMSLINESDIKIKNFKETPEYLKVINTNNLQEHFLTFDSLRSNCRVTHQPDFGEAFIYYKSEKHIDENSLVQYLSSFRSEYHFHEECCEMIFKRIQDILNPDDELFVCALYTRRGGIDICPVRWSKNYSANLAQRLIDLNYFARSGIKQ